MADNYLITGYWGEPHVTAENDRGIHAGIFGAGRFVLPVGEQFRAEYIGNNTIRVYDGKLMDNGAAAGIPAGEYVDLLISNAGQGMKRNDLIVFQYSKDASTQIESGSFVVVEGTETSGTAGDPELTQADLLSNNVSLDQMPLWRVVVSGTAIAAPVKVFEVSEQYSTNNPPPYPVTSVNGNTGAVNTNEFVDYTSQCTWNGALTMHESTSVIKRGNVVECRVRFTTGSSVTSGMNIGQLPSGVLPYATIRTPMMKVWAGTDWHILGVEVDGSMGVSGTKLTASTGYCCYFVYTVD